MSEKIINPILTGFNPDPSIIRVGEDYFIATSTFEWFPGVQIHHSRDLKNWELVARPLDRVSQLDMRGNPDSGGVWAPCLTYHEGTYYLVYTDMKNFNGIWNAHNYLVTTDDIYGTWSDPIYMNSGGFDPSLFHDDERKWFTNMKTDYRTDDKQNKWGNIILQEYLPQKKKLADSTETIFTGTELGSAEAPHIYKENGYYYLIVAEGGTSYNHAVTFARSKSITGPYEVHPQNPVLTSADEPELTLQKAGHADLVKTETGDWYLVHLCGRPLTTRGRCPLGRETAIQKIEWKNDWPYLEGGGQHPKVRVPALDESEEAAEKTNNFRDDFEADTLNIKFQTLRGPLKEDAMSLSERPNHLRLKGQESITSRFYQSLIATRQKDFNYQVTTSVDFEPEIFQQMAGLVCYYNTNNFYYLRISYSEKLGKNLGIIACNKGKLKEPLENNISLQPEEKYHLRVKVEKEKLQFYYSKDEDNWNSIGPVLDAGKLSDEYVKGWGFTGTFVGLCCQDLTGAQQPADFDYFEYIEDNKLKGGIK